MLSHIDPASSSAHAESSASESAESPLVERAAKVHHSASGLSTKLNRGLNILRYYRTSQIIRRATKTLKSKLGLGKKSHSTLDIQPIAGLANKLRAQNEFGLLRKIRSATAFNSPATIRQQLANGDVCVLNETHPLEWRINDNKTLLWQFQLHYHEYLLPLAQDRSVKNPPGQDSSAKQIDAESIQLITETIDSWLAANPISDPASHVDAWHPYCISRRLPVWFCLLTLEGLNSGTREKMLQSAHLQAEFLSKNLEWDLGGNHLLENLRALALAGCFFDTKSSARWLKQVQTILNKQIKEQILPHKEHYERCPMYHCQILGNFLETVIATQAVIPNFAKSLRTVATEMFGFCVEIVHPDGEIPLLGDSCFGEAPSVSCLEQLATAAEIEFSPANQNDPDVSTAGPYWIFRDQNDFLIFDRGAAGADTLPAHAHCDLLTFEASLGGARCFVDSGLYNYSDDPMRWYCRSSLAHNVITVDDQNQNDVWSQFRMGYRGSTTQLQHGRADRFCWAQASHDGFRRMGVEKIDRLIGIEKGRFWYCFDRVRHTNRRLNGFIHLAPDVEISKINDHQFEIICGNTVNQICFVGIKQIELIDGWYCPEFGRREKNVVIEYEFADHSNSSNQANKPGQFQIAGWWMLPNTAQDARIDELTITTSNHETQITLSSPASDDIHSFKWKLTQ